MKRGIVRVSSPFGNEGDLCACGCIYSEGECAIYENLLGVVGFAADRYTAIACCVPVAFSVIKVVSSVSV